MTLKLSYCALGTQMPEARQQYASLILLN